ncbi:MAG: Hsp20/alpha crystallin family protein [Nevskiaceae bacterium]|nr:MAG: Hsp20/alpha crystallin family protein [Nevskiaceae bacterium]
MTALRFNPWATQRDWFNEFSKYFDVAGQDGSSGATADWAPPVDIEEYKDKFVIYADVPGVDPSSIDITLEKGVLTLTGAREQRVSGDDVQSRRAERASGRFFRRFALPDTVDGDSVSASGKNGVLEIVIPKRAQAQPRRIAVHH